MEITNTQYLLFVTGNNPQHLYNLHKDLEDYLSQKGKQLSFTQEKSNLERKEGKVYLIRDIIEGFE